MKRISFMFLLTLLIVTLQVKPAAPLYDQPKPDSIVNSDTAKVRSVQTFEKVYLVLTPFELGARSTTNYRVSFVTRRIPVTGWASPKEGRVHVERDTRRWHRAQRERRVW